MALTHLGSSMHVAKLWLLQQMAFRAMLNSDTKVMAQALVMEDMAEWNISYQKAKRWKDGDKYGLRDFQTEICKGLLR